jgi:uncharacterized membrane protein/protein-disulfide isomerase
MSPRLRWLILGLALVGLAFAGSSSWVHYKLLTDPTYVSPCDINATFNCSQVYLSRFGAIWGVPVALGGLIWFGLAALLAAFAEPGRKDSPALGYLFAWSTIGLAVILYLGYASFFTLRTGCLLCIGTYVSVIGIFLATGMSRAASVGSLPGRFISDLRSVAAQPAAMLAAMLFLAGSASLIAFFPKEGAPRQAVAQPAPGQTDADNFTAAWNAQERRDLGVPAEGAQVVIVKFVDWQCPSCKAAYFAYKPVLERFAQSHPGAVREVTKDYPLSSQCNPFMGSVIHRAACEMAVSVRVARERGKADEMITWFFTAPGQTEITPEQVKAKTAEVLGDPAFAFDKAYAERIDAVRRDTADGGALRVGSTPTYFVNGVLAQTPTGWLPPAYFELAIKIELDKAGGK